MKTNIKKNGDTVIITIQGNLDYENQEPLKRDLDKLATQAATKVIFNFEQLEFVGSSGITHFIQTLSDFQSRITRDQVAKPIFCGVKSEFRRLMKVIDQDNAFEFDDPTPQIRPQKKPMDQ